MVTERAFALLGLGRCLIGAGDRPAATTALAEARDTFARLRAAPALSEAEALLERVKRSGRPVARGPASIDRKWKP